MIKRYDPYDHCMDEELDGEFVTWEDYQAALEETKHLMTTQEHLTEKIDHLIKVKDALVDRLFEKDELIKDLHLCIDKLKEGQFQNEKELWGQSRKLKQKQVRIEDLLEAAKTGGVS